MAGTGNALDPETIKAVGDLAIAQIEANRIEQSRLNIERRRERISLEIIETGTNQAQETRALRHRVEELLDYVRKYALKEDAMQDILSNLSERFETVERALMLVLMERLDSPHVQEEGLKIVGGLNRNLNSASKQRQLVSYYKSLNRLEEQRAEGDDDLKTLNKIDKIKEQILRLEEELKPED